MKKLFVNPLWAFVTLFVLLATFMSQPVFLEAVKLNYFDRLITSKEPTENNIYTVNIDEASLDKWGQWPFPRTVYAELIHNLYARNAGLVIFNVMMPEKDRFNGDAFLANTLAQLPVILPNQPSDKTKNQPKNPGAAIVGSEYLHKIPTAEGIIANVPSLEKNAAGVGIVSTMTEIDGVTRRLPLVVAVDGVLYPSLSLEALRVIAGDPNFQIKLNEYGVEKLRIPKFGIISTEQDGRVWVDWSQTNKSVSAADLPKDFNGAVVIVGVSAAGLSNPVPTAKGSVYPQDVQAALLGTMFNGSNIQRPDWAQSAEYMFILVVGALIILLSRWTYVGLVTTVVGIITPVAASYYYFHNGAFLGDATASTITFVLVALHTYGIKFVSEFLQKQAIKKQFAGYCSKEVVEMLQKDPELIKRGVRKDVSVMFSDLRGFTPIGEHYGDDVGGLAKYMNGYMDAITIPIMNNKGMVIKYVGDASMHMHGAPIDDPNHARTIVKVGLEMLDAVDRYTADMEAQGLPPAAMGWGCNTGTGFIGEMGSTERHGYDILGDMVSTAARLEARCKAYGVLAIIGAETYNRTKDDFFYLYLDNLQPKGKTVADNIYTVLRIKGNEREYIMDRDTHNAMHAWYKQKKFDEAAEMCAMMKGTFNGQMDKYYEIWFERCQFMKQQNLGDDWQGEWIATEK
jgi:adenylate cyclase